MERKEILMRQRKATFPLLILAGLIFLATGPAVAQESHPRLARAIYITQSQNCGCARDKFQAADAAVDQVFAGPRRQLLQRIDYSLDRQAAMPYIGEYRLIQLPALIFLDAQDKVLWLAVGNITDQDVKNKFNQFGG
jgi:hypothetical protein